MLAFNALRRPPALASRTQLSLSPTTRRAQLSHNRSSSLLHQHYLPKARIERARRGRPQRKAGRPKRASASKRSGSKCCCNRSCRRQSRPGIVDLRPTTTASSGERQQSKNASRHHCKAFACDTQTTCTIGARGSIGTIVGHSLRALLASPRAPAPLCISLSAPWRASFAVAIKAARSFGDPSLLATTKRAGAASTRAA